MKRTYFKPEIEILNILSDMQILAGSGGDHGFSVGGNGETQGGNASDGGDYVGTGSRAPGFFGDGIPEED